ncbi:hypothetical protein ABTY20_31335 [Streptomyces sp. NPDC126497]|uniref:hypothetical protein n=1 Tax=Streptomyces sp. NPDC126497 TaxID=3155313 RepID=UPI00332BE448
MNTCVTAVAVAPAGGAGRGTGRHAGAGAGRVVVDTGDGRVTASPARLPGTPDRGVGYADVPLHEDLTVDGVTLHDGRGRDIVSPTPSRP